MVPSTQNLAIAAAAAGVSGHCAYIAARQTAGRGRHDRVWHTGEGNLHFSALLRPGGIAPIPAFWSLMAGLAVHEAVASFMTGARPLLKWPNDLMLGEAKLAGVLIDSALKAGGTLDWVVIGVGVNLAHAPAVPGRRTACLAGHGARVTPRAMAERLMAAIDHWGAQNLATIRTAWLARAHPIGTPLRVQQGDRVSKGIFQGLAEDGALMLAGHDGVMTGEVFFEEGQGSALDPLGPEAPNPHLQE